MVEISDEELLEIVDGLKEFYSDSLEHVTNEDLRTAFEATLIVLECIQVPE